MTSSDQFDGIDVCGMFMFEDSSGKGFDSVVVADLDGALEDDGAGVEVFVDEVDGAAGYFYAVREGLGLGIEAGERG